MEGGVVLCEVLQWCAKGHSVESCGIKQERPYNHDSTASRLLSEVKHDLVRLVLRWGTTLEYLMLFFCFCLFHLFAPTKSTSTSTSMSTSSCTTPQAHTKDPLYSPTVLFPPTPS